MMQKYRTHQEILAEELMNPEFRAIWEANETRRKVVSALIGERIKRKLTQEQLAKRAGLKRPSLARIESGTMMPSLTTLTKLAHAMHTTLEVKFVARP